MRVTFREARQEDGAAMLAVHLAAIRAIEDRFYDRDGRESWAYGLTPEGYGRSMADGEVFELAITEDDRVVGFCGVKDGEILGLYVHPEMQGQGIGRELLERGERRLTRAGYVTLPLTASLNAQAFYAARGYKFVEFGEHKSRGGLLQGVAKMTKQGNIPL